MCHSLDLNWVSSISSPQSIWWREFHHRYTQTTQATALVKISSTMPLDLFSLFWLHALIAVQPWTIYSDYSGDRRSVCQKPVNQIFKTKSNGFAVQCWFDANFLEDTTIRVQCEQLFLQCWWTEWHPKTSFPAPTPWFLQPSIIKKKNSTSLAISLPGWAPCWKKKQSGCPH